MTTECITDEAELINFKAALDEMKMDKAAECLAVAVRKGELKTFSKIEKPIVGFTEVQPDKIVIFLEGQASQLLKIGCPVKTLSSTPDWAVNFDSCFFKKMDVNSFNSKWWKRNFLSEEDISISYSDVVKMGIPEHELKKLFLEEELEAYSIEWEKGKGFPVIKRYDPYEDFPIEYNCYGGWSVIFPEGWEQKTTTLPEKPVLRACLFRKDDIDRLLINKQKIIYDDGTVCGYRQMREYIKENFGISLPENFFSERQRENDKKRQNDFRKDYEERSKIINSYGVKELFKGCPRKNESQNAPIIIKKETLNHWVKTFRHAFPEKYFQSENSETPNKLNKSV